MGSYFILCVQKLILLYRISIEGRVSSTQHLDTVPKTRCGFALKTHVIGMLYSQVIRYFFEMGVHLVPGLYHVRIVCAQALVHVLKQLKVILVVSKVECAVILENLYIQAR